MSKTTHATRDEAANAARPMLDAIAATYGLNITTTHRGDGAAHWAGNVMTSIRAEGTYYVAGQYEPVITVTRMREDGDYGRDLLESRTYRSARAACAYLDRTVPGLAAPAHTTEGTR